MVVVGLGGRVGGGAGGPPPVSSSGGGAGGPTVEGVTQAGDKVLVVGGGIGPLPPPSDEQEGTFPGQSHEFIFGFHTSGWVHFISKSEPWLHT